MTPYDSKPGAKKQLILGLLMDMTLEQARPFFLSLEKAGYEGDICLFVSGLDAATLNFLRARRINLVPFQGPYLKPKWVRPASLARPFLTREKFRQLERQLCTAYLQPHCARHMYYQAYLTECGAGYDQVMLADIRDILFQSDPFDFTMGDGLSVFMEDASRTIGICRHTGGGVSYGFGAEVFKKIQNERVFCAGTIFGTPTAICDYSKRALEIFCARKTRWTIDQATFNYILHLNPPPKVQRFDNDAGPVLTMGVMDPARLRFNEAGRLVNSAGLVYNTLHQYDRHPGLVPQLMKALT